MDVSTEVARFIVVALILHFVARYLVYWAFGVWFGYFNPFSLAVKRCQLQSERYRISVAAIKLRLTVFSDYRRPFTCVFEGVVVEKNANWTPTAKQGAAEPVPELDEDFDPARPVQIFPEDNPRLRRLVKFFFRWFPNLFIALIDVRFVLPHHVAVSASDVRFSYSEKRLPNKEVALNLELNIDQLTVYDDQTNEEFGRLMSNGRAEATLTVSQKTGLVSNSKVGFRVSSTHVSVLRMMRMAELVKKDCAACHKAGTSSGASSGSSRSAISQFGFVFRLLTNADISSDKLVISEIPVGSQENIEKFRSDPTGEHKHVLLTEFSMQSFSITVSKLLSNQVGYDLRFSENDLPVQLILSALRMSVSMNRPGQTAIEVTSISSYTVSVNSTAIANVLALLLNRGKWNACRKSETMVFVRCTISGMTVDLSTTQLGILLSMQRDAQNARTIVKSETVAPPPPPQPSEPCDPTSCKFYPTSFMLSYPWVNFKVSVERPIFMLKVAEKTRRFSHMLVLTPSSCGLDFVLAKHENYSALDCRVDMPDLSLSYRREEGRRSKGFLNLKDAQLKAVINTASQDASSMSVSGNLSAFKLDLTELYSLNGLRAIMDSMEESVCVDRQRAQLAATIKKAKKTQLDPHLLFEELPTWFKQANLTVGEVDVKLGARSLMMPPEMVVSENLKGQLKDVFASSANYLLVKLTRFDLLLRNSSLLRTKVSSDDDSSSARESNSRVPLDPGDYFWGFRTRLESLKVRVHYGSEKVKVATIPDFKMRVFALKKPEKFLVHGDCERIQFDLTLAVQFLVVSSLYMLNNALRHMERPKAVVKKVKKKNAVASIPPSMFIFEFLLREIRLNVVLATGFQLRLDLIETALVLDTNPVSVSIKLARMGVLDDAGLWCRAVQVQQADIHYDLKAAKSADSSKNLDIRMERFTVNVPFDFVVHQLFSGISSTVKVTKHLANILKTNRYDPQQLLPKAKTKPTEFKHTSLRSKEVCVLFDDDSLESQLAMNYQLGLVEQRDRLLKMEKFEEWARAVQSRVQDENVKSEIDELLDKPWLMDPNRKFLSSVSSKLYKVAMNLSNSWIFTVQQFRRKRRAAMKDNLAYIEGLVGDSDEFRRMSSDPSLFSVFLDDVKLVLKPPELQKSETVPLWMHRVGCGIPEDTKYSTLIPLNVLLRTSQLRVHLRDYPLPLVYIPKARAYDTCRTLVLSGNLCVYEGIALGKEQLRWVPINFIPEVSGEASQYVSFTMPRSISSTKLLYELVGKVNTDQVSMVTWGESYSAVLRQLSLAFDKFSKPKTDPSPKLGSWDKMRNLLHGYLRLYWEDPTSEMRVNIKGSMDPYAVVGEAAGYTLCLRQNVCWRINDPQRKHDRDRIVVTADRVSWCISNHLGEPLPCWCSPNLYFVPAVRAYTVVPSMYGYYLNEECVLDTVKPAASSFHTSSTPLKANISLAGKVEIILSFFFERKLADGTRTTQFKPHYENVTKHPDFVTDLEHYDAFDGFRSQFVHMGFTLKVDQSAGNSIHLTPSSLHQFRVWFGLFGNNITTPVKNGPLWQSKSASVKFSRHLFTFKFLFVLEPLYLYHGYRADLSDPDAHELIGLKAKISRFVLDLHMRKEPVLERNDMLDIERKVLKMRPYVGVVSFEEVDLRVVDVTWKQSGDSSGSSSASTDSVSFSIFDNDQDWIDLDDYSELGVADLDGCALEGRILPFMHSSRLQYSLCKHTESSFGNEDSHECRLEQFRMDDSSFANILDAADLQLKWNCDVRDTMLRYREEAKFRSSVLFASNFKSLGLCRSQLDASDDRRPSLAPVKSFHLEELQGHTHASFDAALHEVGQFLGELTAVDFFLVRLSCLQMQLITDDESDSMLLLSAPQLHLKVVKIVQTATESRSPALEVRAGTIFENADISTVYKKDIDTKNGAPSYGSTSSWPIFNSHTGCYSGTLRKSQILSKIQIAFRYDDVSSALENDTRTDKVYLDVPTFETTIDSSDYIAVANLAFNLFIYSEPPEAKRLDQAVRRMVLTTDLADLRRIYDRASVVGAQLKTLCTLSEALAPLCKIRADSRQTALQVRRLLSQLAVESFMYARTILSGDVGSGSRGTCKMEMLVTVRSCTVNLKRDGQEFVSLAIGNGQFQRLEMADGSTRNALKVGCVNAANRTAGAMFPELMCEYEGHANEHTSAPLISITWHMGRPVGGIRVIKEMKVALRPLKVEVDEATARKLWEFLFADDKSPFPLPGRDAHSADEDSLDGLEDDLDAIDMSRDDKFQSISTVQDIVNLDGEGDELVKRANDNFNINEFQQDELVLCISIHATGKLRILNVNRFVLHLAAFQLHNRVLTFAQLLKEIEAHTLRSLLRHSGKMVANKMFKKAKKVHSVPA